LFPLIRGFTALVDDEDFELVHPYKGFADAKGSAKRRVAHL
jgi:hypothetical protein